MKRRLILASGSPRRRELLEGLGLEFEIVVDPSEEVLREGMTPADTVELLSREKAEHVAAQTEDPALIIAADTVVALDSQILCKPKDRDEATRMLMSLSGRKHQVYTGLTVLDTGSGKSVSVYEVTTVEFRPVPADEISRYIDTGEPMDKAGAYGIQNLGALFVKGIEGDYFNVVGLPLCRLGEVLKSKFGLDLI